MLRHEWFNVGDVCAECHGCGSIEECCANGDDMPEWRIVPCPDCDGGRTWRRVEALSDAGAAALVAKWDGLGEESYAGGSSSEPCGAGAMVTLFSDEGTPSVQYLVFRSVAP